MSRWKRYRAKLKREALRRPAQSLGDEYRHAATSERGCRGAGQQDGPHGLGHAAQ